MNWYFFYIPDGWFPLKLTNDQDAAEKAVELPDILEVVSDSTGETVWKKEEEANPPGFKTFYR